MEKIAYTIINSDSSNLFDARVLKLALRNSCWTTGVMTGCG